MMKKATFVKCLVQAVVSVSTLLGVAADLDTDYM